MFRIWNKLASLFSRSTIKTFVPFHRADLGHSSLFVAFWYGTLQPTPKLLHFVSVDKTAAGYTVRMGYKTADHRTIELFRQQQDYKLPGLRSEYVAVEVASLVANQLQSTTQKAMLLGSDTHYWVLIANSAMKTLLREGLENAGLTLESYQKNADFYKNKYSL